MKSSTNKLNYGDKQAMSENCLQAKFTNIALHGNFPKVGTRQIIGKHN